MKTLLSFPEGLAAIWLLAWSSTVIAHTWVENVRLIASNGTFVGAPGYPRGYIPRSSPGFSDIAAENKVPPDGRSTGSMILPTDLMCKSTQTLGNQTAGYPTIAAAPQDQIALRYFENGHVTLFFNQPGKPLGRGTVFIYGTKQPLPTDTYLGIHRVWNADGTGGDKRGKLLSTRPFDDGRCFQVNSASLTDQRQKEFNFPPNQELGCQADFQVPSDAGTSGTYTVYWVWEWPYLYNNGALQTNESYTSCLDISLTSNAVSAAGSFDTSQLSGIDANSAGIQAQLSTQFLVNPTALPQIAPDNLNKASTPPDVPAPNQPPAAATLGSASAAPSPNSVSSSAAATTVAGEKFVTVTITENNYQTVTVTEMVPIASGQAPTTSQAAIITKSTATVVPLPASSASSVSSIASASSSSSSSSSSESSTSGSTLSIQPSIVAAVSKPSGSYTKATTTPVFTPFLNVTGPAAATSDCPDMTSSSVRAKRTLQLRGRYVRW